MVSLEVNDTGIGTNQDEVEKTNGFGWAQVSERLLPLMAINLLLI